MSVSLQYFLHCVPVRDSVFTHLRISTRLTRLLGFLTMTSFAATPRALASRERTRAFALPCSGGSLTLIQYSVSLTRSIDSCFACGLTRSVRNIRIPALPYALSRQQSRARSVLRERCRVLQCLVQYPVDRWRRQSLSFSGLFRLNLRPSYRNCLL